MTQEPRARSGPVSDPRPWGRVGLAWLRGFRDHGAWGFRHLGDPRASRAKRQADNSTAERAPRHPPPERVPGQVRGSEWSGPLVPQRTGTSRNRYYVSLAGGKACASARSGGSPSFSSAGPSKNVSSQPRRFSAVSKTDPDRLAESSRKPSGTAHPAPRPLKAGSALGAGGVSIPGGGAFSSCLAMGFVLPYFSLSGVG